VDYPIYEGLLIITVQTRKGQKNVLDELLQHEMDLDDVAEILSNGYDCSRSKRRVDVVEKCMDKGNKTMKAVVQKGTLMFDNKECWELIHVGKFSRRK